jgi:hypothetical protein
MTLSTKTLVTLALTLFLTSTLQAADQTVPLPYTSPDKDGNSWMVHFYGYLQQQGNMPVYSNAGVLTINGTNSAGRIVQRQDRRQDRRADPRKPPDGHGHRHPPLPIQ